MEWMSTMSELKKEVLDLLKTSNQAAYEYAKEQYSCFNPHKGDSWGYANAADCRNKNWQQLQKCSRVYKKQSKQLFRALR